MEVKNSAQEKIIKAKSGWAVLILSILLYVADIFALGICGMKMENSYGEVSGLYVALFVLTMIYVCLGWIWWLGLKVIGPNEALVLTLFGKYIGTLKDEGFFYVNPFCAAVNRHKINDCLGNPIEIGIAVMWRVSDTAKAVFNVDNFKEYLSLQCDAALREIVRIYPYDVAPNVDTTGDGIADEGSLRGSSEIVASRIREKIEEKVGFAGLEIIEARITYLAYAPEIAAIMLQRQQASAIIDARKMIVDGAVGMVQMALDKINSDNICELDDERKAQMVSNLLVVLCGNQNAQPVINSGSIY